MSNESTNRSRYKQELVKCFNFSFNTSHDHSHIFSNDKLFQLTPEHIYGFLAEKVFGTSSPLEDCKPMYGRASSMEFTKKAILYFMPNRLMKWVV